MRRVYLVEGFTKLTWSKLNSIQYNKTFPISDIEVLKLGKKTDNIKRFKKAVENMCFSIVMKDRTIDLECQDQAEMKKLYFGLKFFMKVAQRFKRNMLLYNSLPDDFPLDIFDEAVYADPQ